MRRKDAMAEEKPEELRPSAGWVVLHLYHRIERDTWQRLSSDERAAAVGSPEVQKLLAEAPEIVGIMEVSREAKPDGEGKHWVSVEMKPVEPLANPVTLKMVKAEPRLAAMELVKYSRLSVGKVSAAEWDWPCMGTASAVTPPRLPTPLPP